MRALILTKTAYGESDLIVKFLTAEGRLVSVFAAGARRSRRRFPHQFHEAGVYEIDSVSTQKLSRLHSCELVEFYPQLTAHPESWARWCTVIEWVALHDQESFDFQTVYELMRELAERRSVTAHHDFFVEQMRRHGVLPEGKWQHEMASALGVSKSSSLDDLLFPFLEQHLGMRLQSYRVLSSLMALPQS